jgi:hypothetical protein
LASYLADLAVLAGLSAVSMLFTRSWILPAIVAVELYAVLTLFRARTGRSPGAYLTKTAAVQAGTDHAPGLKAQLVRAALFGLLQLTVVGPLISLLASKEGQDWMDRLAGIVVCDLRERPRQPAQPLDVYGRLAAVAPGAVPTLQLAQQQAFPASQPEQRQPAFVIPQASQQQAAFAAPQPLPPRQPGFEQAGPTPPLPEPVSTQPPQATAEPAQADAAQPEPAHELPAPLQPKRSLFEPATGAAVRPETGSRFVVAPPPAPLVPANPLPGPPPGAGQVGPVVWITFDSGESIPADKVAVLGREPSLQPGLGEIPIRVTDPSASISRTHLRIGADGNGIWVEDSFSANGTYLIGEGGRELLERGRRIYLPAGSRLGLGERTVQLTLAETRAGHGY